MSEQQEPKEKKTPLMPLNLVLAAGFVFMLAGVFLLVLFSTNAYPRISIIRSLLTTLAGSLILYYTLIKSKGSWMLFAGLFLCLVGIFLLLIDVKTTSYSLEKLWPMIVILCGVSVFVAGVYKAKKVQLGFLVPAIVIILLGCLFLLFSMDIITESFFSIASQWWPSILILAGGCLVTVFFIWNKKNPLGDTVADDDDDFSDISDGDSR